MSTSQPAPQPHSGPAPGFAGDHGHQPAPKKKSKGPKILMIVGGIIMLLSVIIGTLITVLGVGNAADGLSKIQVLPGGSGVVTAEEGDSLQLYAPEGTAMPACAIMTPDGSEPGPGTNQTSTTTIDGTNWASFASFEATTTGDYQIECDSAQVAVGPPVSVGGVLGAIGGILLGIGGGILGFLLLLAGLIWWFVTRNKTA